MSSPSMPADVVMYRTPFCPYCVRAAHLLEKKGAKVREIDVSGDRACRDWLIQTTGMRTVPQIFINGRSVKGFDDIAELDRRGELDRLLREPPPAYQSAPAPCAG